MKKITTSILFFLILFISVSAKNIEIDGVKYTLKGSGINGKVSVKVRDKKSLPSDLVVPDAVLIDGRDYPVVELEEGAFKGCKRLKSVTLPNTVTSIGKQAFWNCTSLVNVVMPDEATVDVDKGNFGFDEGGIFKGCKELESVTGINIPYPQYVIYESIYNCNETPFYQKVQNLGAVNFTRQKKTNSFKEYALERVKTPVEQWQKRKDFETVAQWEERVNDKNRKKMIEETMAEARNEYIKLFAPKTLRGSLDPYNSEYGFFAITTPNMGILYVSVPKEDSDNFKNQWHNVQIQPVYGILDGELAVLDCYFNLDGKLYPSARKYDEDELSMIAVNITPLSALREYEQMLAAGVNQGGQQTAKRFDPDIVDIEIPVTEDINNNTFAVIIGNENYHRVAPVEYAMNDARIFAKYCNRTLGIPENNIRAYYNCSLVNLREAMKDISSISNAYKGDIKVIFYYAGHGVPDESNRNAYLLPIDASGKDFEDCYPLSQLYEELSQLSSNSIVAFIDACFSGSLRGDGMLESARGIKLRPKDIPANGNLIVLSAASGDESAYPLHEKSHGLFSYYLIKKLYDSKGDVKIGDLADYISSEVQKYSIVEIKKTQTPSIKVSDTLSESWRDIQLR